MNLQELLRANIRNLEPYSCARDEFKGEASVYLDANENPYNAPYNRYPDPLQWEVKKRISTQKGVHIENIFLGNGSDEPIDLLYRAFCEPRIDNVVAIDPTYGMYKVCASINDVEYRQVLLNDEYQFAADELLQATDEHTKLIWLCSPNNPTGNSLNPDEIKKTLDNFNGIVVVDEAYIDFSSQQSFASRLSHYPNLVILQTFSKAWGSAAIRLGMAFASPEIVQVLNKIKYPYNINILTQQQALDVLDNAERTKQWVETLLKERANLIEELKKIPLVQHIYPTDANFILIKVSDANSVYHYLTDKGIIVRNRTKVSLCLNSLRVTVGTPEENKILLEELKKYNN
ncbi:histidinol-phosphate transaminase [Paludibacter sp. 221]|uniref:histidinol-phosphate transaminase n=1 Tax=Paludibacter sp. 221 TaxID=2302939 RepID=UPI0013D19FD2|nr:histidinol-phosphate transaminase [Paludibacter sp. 221]NDV46794.1 histidinol-phosphate transaminase [Paludibacter sp. 221]